MKIIDPTNLTQTTTRTINHVGTTTKMIMQINMVSEKTHTNRTDQSHQEMNITKPGDEKICHEPTDIPSKITPPRTAKSDPARISLHGIPTGNNFETYLKCRRSKALVETIRSGIFDTNRTSQTHQEMNTTNPGDEKI